MAGIESSCNSVDSLKRELSPDMFIIDIWHTKLCKLYDTCSNLAA